MPQAANAARPKKTRIQTQNEELILAAALEVFSAFGYPGCDRRPDRRPLRAVEANLLYYFRRKEDIYVALLEHTLDDWLEPLRALDAAGDPIENSRATSAPRSACRATIRRPRGSSPTRSCTARRPSAVS